MKKVFLQLFAFVAVLGTISLTSCSKSKEETIGLSDQLDNQTLILDAATLNSYNITNYTVEQQDPAQPKPVMVTMHVNGPGMQSPSQLYTNIDGWNTNTFVISKGSTSTQINLTFIDKQGSRGVFVTRSGMTNSVPNSFLSICNTESWQSSTGPTQPGGPVNVVVTTSYYFPLSLLSGAYEIKEITGGFELARDFAGQTVTLRLRK